MPKNNQPDTITAEKLKNELWDTLKGVQSGKVDVHKAAAIGVLGHGILRTVKLELEIAHADSVTQSIADFTGQTLLENETDEKEEE